MNAHTLSKSLSAIRGTPLIGPFLRWLVRQYPEGSTTKIRAGAAKGLRWKRYHRYDPGTWMGAYEPPLQKALVRMLGRGDVFYDVGANAGFFAVLAARLVGADGSVIAFEPHPLNIESIAAQIEVNGFGNITLIPKAVSSQDGAVRFSVSDKLSQGHLGNPRTDEQAMEVQAITLDQAARLCAPPSLIKVDIEGGGVDLVDGARKVTAEHRPVWILEVHNKEEETAFKELLLPLGYRFESLNQRAIEPNETLPGHVIASCREALQSRIVR